MVKSNRDTDFSKNSGLQSPESVDIENKNKGGPITKINKHEWLKTAGLSVGILVFISILCMVISLISVARICTTEPYRHSVDLALKSPKVRQALGEPVTAGWLPQGAVNASNGGKAELYIPLRGTNASAKIRVVATNINGCVIHIYGFRSPKAENNNLYLNGHNQE